MTPAVKMSQRLHESGRSIGYATLLAGLWCGLEWVRGWMLTGFGWNGLGVAFHDQLVLAQGAEFIGVIGLSFLPVFFSAIVVQFAHRFYHQSIRRGAKLLYWDLATGLILIMLALTLGNLRIHAMRNQEVIEVRALLVQQDIPQLAYTVSWEPERVLDGFIELTEQAFDEIDQEVETSIRSAEVTEGEQVMNLNYPDLVVWPESSLAEWFQVEQDQSVRAGEVLESALNYVRNLGDFTLLAGVMAKEVEGNYWKENGKTWNSLLAIDSSNQRSMYHKRHRVIFGEFIPEIPFLRQLYEHSAGVEYQDNISKGEGGQNMKLLIEGHELEVIPSICFEDTVPREPRQFIRDLPQVIVNVTNDGWFQKSEGAAQHFANAKFRCIELRRPMIRCANRGATAIVSTIGATQDPFSNQDRRLVDQGGSHFTRGSLVASAWVPQFPTKTLYALWGDWFAVSGLILAFVWMLLLSYQGVRPSK